MILPTKHIPAEQTLLGVGSLLLQYLNQPKNISYLWDEVKKLPPIGTYERFVLGLDMLYILGLIKLNDGKAEKI